MRKCFEHSSIPFPIKMNWQTCKKTHESSLFWRLWRSLAESNRSLHRERVASSPIDEGSENVRLAGTDRSRHCRFALVTNKYIRQINALGWRWRRAEPGPWRIDPGGGARTYNGVWAAGQAAGNPPFWRQTEGRATPNGPYFLRGLNGF